MNVLILGATSAIAQAVAREYCATRSAISFVLVARNTARLQEIADDLKVRGAASVALINADLANGDGAAAVIEQCWQAVPGGLDVALIAHGILPDQASIENDWPAIRDNFEVNALSYLACMTALAQKFANEHRGTIAVIGSVAGDRGRKSNYIYGSAKGAVALFAQGLRNRLYAQGVHVLTIKPGFVDTPMTRDFAKGGPLWASPEAVARTIVKAIDAKRNILYVPLFWWGIMAIIRSIPEILFKRLSL